MLIDHCYSNHSSMLIISTEVSHVSDPGKSDTNNATVDTSVVTSILTAYKVFDFRACLITLSISPTHLPPVFAFTLNS